MQTILPLSSFNIFTPSSYLLSQLFLLLSSYPPSSSFPLRQCVSPFHSSYFCILPHPPPSFINSPFLSTLPTSVSYPHPGFINFSFLSALPTSVCLLSSAFLPVPIFLSPRSSYFLTAFPSTVSLFPLVLPHYRSPFSSTLSFPLPFPRDLLFSFIPPTLIIHPLSFSALFLVFVIHLSPPPPPAVEYGCISPIARGGWRL
jgi:hypothetical protein